MKSQIFVTAAVLFFSAQAFAGNKNKPETTAGKTATSVAAPVNVCLTGTIVDEQTKETLAGVEVSVEGTQLKTYTDFEGKFSFDNLQPGNYKVVTKYVSYNKIESREVVIKANEMHSLNLELTAQNTLPQLDSTSAQTLLAGK
ncbi:MAG: carboxypeptidase-like regulatory domain-containing protein [Breznakibacter sp.]